MSARELARQWLLRNRRKSVLRRVASDKHARFTNVLADVSEAEIDMVISNAETWLEDALSMPDDKGAADNARSLAEIVEAIGDSQWVRATGNERESDLWEQCANVSARADLHTPDELARIRRFSDGCNEFAAYLRKHGEKP